MIATSTSVMDSRNTVHFSDLFPTYDAEQAKTFLHELFGKTVAGYIAISAAKANPRAWAPNWMNGSNSWSEIQELLRQHPDFFSFSTNTWAQWNTYVQVGSTMRCGLSKGERGKEEYALDLPGLFADFDVKPKNGTFRSREELDAYLATLPEPTMLVNSAGSDGGVHAYWLYDRPHRVHNYKNRVELDGWYDYLAHQAAAVDRSIDHVQDYARVLRVPGTVRWPKKVRNAGEPDTWKPVELIKSGGPRYDHDEMLAFTEHYRRVAVERHETARTDWKGVRDSQLEWLSGLGLTRGAQGLWEARFNDLQDWGPLLEAAGWKLHSDNRDQDSHSACRYWTRPGKSVEDGWSASTDYKGSKVMYVFTEFPEINPCIVPTSDRFTKITTKYAFALHFLAGGDESRLMHAICQGGGRVL